MAKTPITESITLAAGATSRIIPREGHWLRIISSTALSFEFAFDSDAFTKGYPEYAYPCPEGFTRIRFRDSLGAGCTIEYLVSDTLSNDDRKGLAILASILSALLAAIDQPSTDGESNHIDLDASGGADPHKTLPDQACREVQCKTGGSTVYYRLKSGAVDSDATRHLMEAGMEYTFAVSNCNLLHFYNGDAANTAIVYYTWRN